MADPNDLKRIQIICPQCGAAGFVHVSKSLIQNSTRGVSTINIPKNQVCEHNFIAYVDKNFAVRDYFVADVSLEDLAVATEGGNSQASSSKKKIAITESDYHQIRGIIGRKLFTYILHAIFLNSPLHLIYEKTEFFDQIVGVFEAITANAFEISLSIGTFRDYMTNKTDYNGVIVLDVASEMVLEDEIGILKMKKYITESEMIDKSFKQSNPTTSFIVMKNEIQKLYSLANIVKLMLQEKSGNEGDKWSKKEIANQLEKRNNIKIPMKQLLFIFDIIEFNFNIRCEKYL